MIKNLRIILAMWTPAFSGEADDAIRRTRYPLRPGDIVIYNGTLILLKEHILMEKESFLRMGYLQLLRKSLSSSTQEDGGYHNRRK